MILVLVLASAVALTGVRWGLPSRHSDRYLFGTRTPWSGKRLAELKGDDWHRRNGVGADVDVDPIRQRERAVDLTATDRRRAEILVRYRLYTHQPDEPITLRALAGMQPSRLRMDPKLYQYGGLFIYPVGVLVGLASACGLIEVRSDLTYYFDHPSAFGAMYVVVRAYSAMFGLVGVIACYLLGRRLDCGAMGLLAGVLFVLMPVVITLSHEGKPHLPGAVMMLLAGWTAMRYLETGRSSQWWATAVLCGLTTATVLSAWPVVATMVVAAVLRPCETRRRTVWRVLAGMLIAAAVFLLANPYLLVNLVVDRDVLRSNLGTSTGMYQIGRIGEGAWNVGRLLVEGAGPTLAAAGTVALMILVARRTRLILPLLAPGVLVLLQFACIGAGKPGEYGRFLIMPAALMAVAAAWGLAAAIRWHRVIGAGLLGLVLVTTAWDGYRYLAGFVRDAKTTNSRIAAADWLSARLVDEPDATIGLVREPAPYCVPPLDFDRRRVTLLPERRPDEMTTWPDYVVATADRPDAFDAAWWAGRYRKAAVLPAGLDQWLGRPTTISWADKPVVIFSRRSDRE